MKALILAAGLGTRLAPLTDNMPKSLVSVNGKPILMKQIENLYESNIDDITIVSGYKANILKATVYAYYPDIHIIESTDYASTNNMYSAYLGIKAMFPTGIIAPFLMMNADVFYDASVIKTLISCQYPNSIVTEVGQYFEESMKVEEKNGRLIAISKQIPPELAYGTTIDVYRFASDGGTAFFRRCADYIENKKELKLWSEVALNDALADIEFKPCPLEGRWLEIDNHEDLAAAEKLFAE